MEPSGKTFGAPKKDRTIHIKFFIIVLHVFQTYFVLFLVQLFVRLCFDFVEATFSQYNNIVFNANVNHKVF
jgi:hypothetical protein